jgi:Ca2+-binding RTX toxin-like protein
MPSPTRVTVRGSAAADLLIAHPEPSRMIGLDGNDILIDGPGSDLLEGGGGINRQFGGLGNDYYRHDIYADGRQLILDMDPTPGNIDTLIVEESLEEFGPFERYGDDLLIGLHSQPAVITVRQFFLDASFRIERFRFGATTLTDQDVLRAFNIDPSMPTGRSADDPPSQTGERVRLTGGQAADRLVAADQPSYILGRGGNDLLIGSRYSDVLNGGDSVPMMLGDNQWNRLYGGPGNDYYQVDYSGWQGNQRILDYDPTPGNLDTLHIRGDIGPQHVRFYGSERGDLTLELDEQRIVIENYFLNRAFVIEKIRFDDGSVLNEAAIRRRLNLAPPASAQVESVLQQGSMNPPQLKAPELPASDSSLGLVLLGAALFNRLGG